MALKKHLQQGKDSLKFTTPRGHIVQRVGGNSSPQQGHGILLFYHLPFLLHLLSTPPLLHISKPNRGKYIKPPTPAAQGLSERFNRLVPLITFIILLIIIPVPQSLCGTLRTDPIWKI